MQYGGLNFLRANYKREYNFINSYNAEMGRFFVIPIIVLCNKEIISTE